MHIKLVSSGYSSSSYSISSSYSELNVTLSTVNLFYNAFFWFRIDRGNARSEFSVPEVALVIDP